MKTVINSIRSALAVTIVCSGAVAGAQQAPPVPEATRVQVPEPAVLTIGAQHWSAERFSTLRSAGGPADDLNPEQLATFVQNFAERYVMARQAETEGLGDDARVAAKLALARDRVLAEEQRAWLQKTAPIDAAAVRADFDARPGRYNELRLSQILVRINDQDRSLPPARRRNAAQALARATSIRRQLQRGANFNNLARRYSDDDASRRSGGDLPFIFEKDLKPEVLPTIRTLQPQEVSAPVLASDGYHLIRLEERMATDFEGARRLLELELRAAWAERQIHQLLAETPVTFDAAAGQAQEDARAHAPSANLTLSQSP